MSRRFHQWIIWPSRYQASMKLNKSVGWWNLVICSFRLHIALRVSITLYTLLKCRLHYWTWNVLNLIHCGNLWTVLALEVELFWNLFQQVFLLSHQSKPYHFTVPSIYFAHCRSKFFQISGSLSSSGECFASRISQSINTFNVCFTHFLNILKKLFPHSHRLCLFHRSHM